MNNVQNSLPEVPQLAAARKNPPADCGGGKSPLDGGGGAGYASATRLSGYMYFPRWLFLLLLYTAAVFGWIVFFEHGPGWSRFRNGAEVEMERAWDSLQARWSAGKPAK